MKELVRGAAFVSALSMPANPVLTQSASACESPPDLVSPLETGMFIVSTYHTTGVAGSDRVIQLQWPSELKVPISGVPRGRADGAEKSMAFNIPSATASMKRGDGSFDQVSFPRFSIFLGGVIFIHFTLAYPLLEECRNLEKF